MTSQSIGAPKSTPLIPLHVRLLFRSLLKYSLNSSNIIASIHFDVVHNFLCFSIIVLYLWCIPRTKDASFSQAVLLRAHYFLHRLVYPLILSAYNSCIYMYICRILVYASNSNVQRAENHDVCTRGGTTKRSMVLCFVKTRERERDRCRTPRRTGFSLLMPLSSSSRLLLLGAYMNSGLKVVQYVTICCT